VRSSVQGMPARPARKCNMDGDGIVIFAVRLVCDRRFLLLTFNSGPRILMNRDAIKLSQKIGVPVLAPNFAVCNRGETDDSWRMTIFRIVASPTGA
jgi:hypothetical protein